MTPPNHVQLPAGRETKRAIGKWSNSKQFPPTRAWFEKEEAYCNKMVQQKAVGVGEGLEKPRFREDCVLLACFWFFFFFLSIGRKKRKELLLSSQTEACRNQNVLQMFLSRTRILAVSSPPRSPSFPSPVSSKTQLLSEIFHASPHSLSDMKFVIRQIDCLLCYCNNIFSHDSCLFRSLLHPNTQTKAYHKMFVK